MYLRGTGRDLNDRKVGIENMILKGMGLGSLMFWWVGMFVWGVGHFGRWVMWCNAPQCWSLHDCVTRGDGTLARQGRYVGVTVFVGFV